MNRLYVYLPASKQVPGASMGDCLTTLHQSGNILLLSHRFLHPLGVADEETDPGVLGPTRVSLMELQAVTVLTWE